MSSDLWNALPNDFLRIGYRAWDRFGYELKLLIVQLAKEQDFKCALCGANRRLIVEHDHEPEFGSGVKQTIYNTRGLTCQRCNWHLKLYETNQNGEYFGWDHVNCRISDRDYDDYVYRYSIRVASLHEEARKSSISPANYWKRRIFLDKFDDWRQWGDRYPWRWEFGKIKQRKRRTIRTPEQFIRTLSALVKFVKTQTESDPEFEIPDSFVDIMIKLKPMFDELNLEHNTAQPSRSDLRPL